MAVYTEVSDADLAAFLETYDLGGVRALKGIAEGVENSNFLLHTEKGDFILTLYEKRVEAASLPFFLALLDHLAERGLSCPRPVRARSGAALGAAVRAPGGDRHLSRRRLPQSARRRRLRADRRGARADCIGPPPISKARAPTP